MFDLGLQPGSVGLIVALIGKVACVRVTASKHATAHDLRRSSGSRWSNRVKPAYLQQLMRHRDIKTTMDFYVGHDSDDILADLWRDFRKGDTDGKRQQPGKYDVATSQISKRH